MSDDVGSRKIEVICPECGEAIVVADPAGLIRSLHLQNACEATGKIVGARE